MNDSHCQKLKISTNRQRLRQWKWRHRRRRRYRWRWHNIYNSIEKTVGKQVEYILIRKKHIYADFSAHTMGVGKVLPIGSKKSEQIVVGLSEFWAEDHANGKATTELGRRHQAIYRKRAKRAWNWQPIARDRENGKKLKETCLRYEGQQG